MKFKIFEYNELDPYEEEDWSDPIFYTIDDLKIGDRIYIHNDFYGEISSIGVTEITFKDKTLSGNWHTWVTRINLILFRLNDGRMEIK